MEFKSIHVFRLIYAAYTDGVVMDDELIVVEKTVGAIPSLEARRLLDDPPISPIGVDSTLTILLSLIEAGSEFSFASLTWSIILLFTE